MPTKRQRRRLPPSPACPTSSSSPPASRITRTASPTFRGRERNARRRPHIAVTMRPFLRRVVVILHLSRLDDLVPEVAAQLSRRSEIDLAAKTVSELDFHARHGQISRPRAF